MIQMQTPLIAGSSMHIDTRTSHGNAGAGSHCVLQNPSTNECGVGQVVLEQGSVNSENQMNYSGCKGIV